MNRQQQVVIEYLPAESAIVGWLRSTLTAFALNDLRLKLEPAVTSSHACRVKDTLLFDAVLFWAAAFAAWIPSVTRRGA